MEALLTGAVRTHISTYLRSIQAMPERACTVRVNDFYHRLRNLPTHAARWEGKAAQNAFKLPPDLHMSVIPLLTGNMKPDKINKDFVTPLYEMLLLAFEAKPRPISFAMAGYSPVDFMAYIYQDVYSREKDIPLDDIESNFGKWRNPIVDWLRSPRDESIENNATRHVRWRFALLFDRGYSQIAARQNRAEGNTALTNLISKLFESDQETGYANGSLRDFRLVRQDFNLLAERCFLLRHRDDPVKMERFARVICPAKVNGPFSEHNIAFKRGPKSGQRRAPRRA